MAIAFDMANQGDQAGAGPVLEFQLQVYGENRILLVGTWVPDPALAYIESITYNNDSLTKIDEVNAAAMGHLELWYMVAPDLGGSYNVTLTSVGNPGDWTACAVSYTGVDQSTPYINSQKAGHPDTNPWVPSITVSSAIGEVVVDFMGGYKGSFPDIQPGAGQTRRSFTSTYDGSYHGAMSEEAGAASVQMTWDQMTMMSGIIGVSLKPSGSLIGKRAPLPQAYRI